jgi:hypothetical protein
VNTKHKNPTGYWSRKGQITVYLTADAKAPPVGYQSGPGNSFTFRGEVGQSMGGIGVECGEKKFYWGYRFLKQINVDGQIVWQNNNIDKM